MFFCLLFLQIDGPLLLLCTVLCHWHHSQHGQRYCWSKESFLRHHWKQEGNPAGALWLHISTFQWPRYVKEVFVEYCCVVFVSSQSKCIIHWLININYVYYIQILDLWFRQPMQMCSKIASTSCQQVGEETSQSWACLDCRCFPHLSTGIINSDNNVF